MKRNFIIIAIIGLVLYFPSLFGPFLWDDEDFVYANTYVKDFRIDKFFTESQTAGRGKVSNYYRPLPQITYATTHIIFGFTPFWFHLLNVLIHVGAACTIYAFFKLLLENLKPPSSLIPVLISLIFLVHPVQTEAVSYISGLSDPLFVLFGFLSLISFLRSKLWWSLGFFALCLLSKETGLVFLPLLIIIGFVTNSWKKLWPQTVTAVTYLWFHFTYLNTFDIKAAWGNTFYANNLHVRLLTFIQNLFIYVGLLIFPKDLFMERDFTPQIQADFLNPYLLIFVLLNLPLLYLLLKTKNKLLIFCYFGFFVSFIPYTGIVLINGIFYEHFLYLPLVFFFAFWLLLFQKYLKNTYVLYTIYFVLLLLSLRNFARQFDWNDSIRFYSQTLKRAPQSIRILNGLGMAYADQGNLESSLNTYHKALKINPGVPNIYHNMANLYAARGQLDLAEKNYLKALAVDPNFLYSAQSLANLYQQTGQKDKLEALVKKYSR